MTRTERHDYLMFLSGIGIVGIQVWAMTIAAYFYVFEGEAVDIIWVVVNLFCVAICLHSAFRNLRLKGLSRLVDLTEDAIKEAMRDPTPENARKVKDLHAQMNAVRERDFPHWTR